jgi:hypothetical protein
LQFLNHYALITNVRKAFSEAEMPEGNEKDRESPTYLGKMAGTPARKRKAFIKQAFRMEGITNE